jgi:AraC family transcriptional activator of pyochelin receptor
MKHVHLRRADKEILAALKAYIETLPEPVLTITELSMKFGINTDKLKKGFKELYGVAPYRYVLELRLALGKQLLSETEMPVADIAIQLGYEYAENFSAWFKGVTGVRPLEWRYNV